MFRVRRRRTERVLRQGRNNLHKTLQVRVPFFYIRRDLYSLSFHTVLQPQLLLQLPCVCNLLSPLYTHRPRVQALFLLLYPALHVNAHNMTRRESQENILQVLQIPH